MLDQFSLSNILFIDLETVSGSADFHSVSPRLQGHWEKKSKFVLRKYQDVPTTEEVASSYQDKAAIYAEFGKIVCISIGYVHAHTGELRLKSFCHNVEKTLLIDFLNLINKHYTDPARNLVCGHNIKEFDIPYLCRRLVINGLALPNIFQLAGKKPWETKHLIDTLQLWKFGDLKHYTSLDLLAAIFDVDTPKDDIDGSMVGRVYWQEQDLKRIAIYCEKDVVTVAQVLLKMMGKDLIPADKIVSV
ncbi:MAG: 3'-5' exonuclease [Saprospiraceae bacterium]|nr:3'-5' exonuclease [Saprospiraceae bacterium]